MVNESYQNNNLNHKYCLDLVLNETGSIANKKIFNIRNVNEAAHIQVLDILTAKSATSLCIVTREVEMSHEKSKNSSFWVTISTER